VKLQIGNLELDGQGASFPERFAAQNGVKIACLAPLGALR
jgi:hypothetical protein